MASKSDRFVYWFPRIFSMIFILFLMLFSLDIFDMKFGFWDAVVGLFMHNIPALILLIVLIISWRYEIVGAIAFILAGLIYTILTTFSDIPWYMAISWSLTIAGPAFIVGIFFLIGWFKKKKQSVKSMSYKKK